jgi:hypothetical protein
MKRIAAILACVLLAGCYESQSMLLDPSAARQPVASNSDYTDTRDGQAYHDRLIARSDGWYDFSEAMRNSDGTEGEWETHTVLLNDLGNSNGWALYAYGTWDDTEKAYVYGIVAVGANGVWRSAGPDCSGDDPPGLAPAQQAGAQIGQGICTFTSASGLLDALRAYTDTAAFWTAINTPHG